MAITITKHQRFYGVYETELGRRKLLLTQNLVPGVQVYGENLFKQDGIEYREWIVQKSKLAAAIAKGISQIGIKPGSSVLYLGCASGTTASHVSDIVGKEGFVFALDFAPRSLRDIVFVCQMRKNMTALLADAHHPERYVHRVLPVDVVFQDIAQRDQTGIFLKNCDLFLKQGGFGLLVVKARSVDVTKRPKEIFARVREQLEQRVTIVDYRELDPYERDHCMFVVKRK